MCFQCPEDRAPSATGMQESSGFSFSLILAGRGTPGWGEGIKSVTFSPLFHDNLNLWLEFVLIHVWSWLEKSFFGVGSGLCI